MADDVIYKVTPTVTASASPDYSTGDSIGGKIALTKLAARCPNGGLIVGCRLVSDVVSTIDFEVVFFAGDPSGSTFTDNAALDIVAADQPKLIGRVLLDTDADIGGCSIHEPSRQLAIPFEGQSGGDLYAAIIARGTLNLAATTDIALSVWAMPA